MSFNSFVADKKSSPTSWFPEFYFKLNSTQTVDSTRHISSKVPSDSLFGDVKDVLVTNPQILVMEISGFADANEKNQKKLSQDRANKIKNELVRRGVDSTRLLAVGYGSTMPLVPTKDILAEKDLKKREALRQINRRVSFKITKLADK